MENYDLKAPNPLYGLIFLMSCACQSNVNYMACILSIYTRMPFVCQSYVLVRHLYVTSMYLYVMLCHLYVLVCHPYVTSMYSYVIRVSLVSTHMPSVCHSHVLVCHLYVTRMW